MSNEDLQQIAALMQQTIHTEVKEIVHDEVRETVRQELAPIHQQLDKIEQRLDKVEQRLDKVEQRLDKVEAEQHRQAVMMEEMQGKLQLCCEGISTCNSRLDRIEQKIADYDDVKNHLFAVETVVVDHTAALIELRKKSVPA